MPRPRRPRTWWSGTSPARSPGAKLVGDITYIRTWEGWLYLATVLDCHSKRVLGWSMAEHMRTDLICDAITMAATTIEFAAGAVFHSDRGSQYTSEQFRTHLPSHGLTASIGRTGVCWDNAMAESFHGALKNELVYRTAYPTRDTPALTLPNTSRCSTITSACTRRWATEPR